MARFTSKDMPIFARSPLDGSDDSVVIPEAGDTATPDFDVADGAGDTDIGKDIWTEGDSLDFVDTTETDDSEDSG